MPIEEITVRSLGELIDRITPTEPDARTGRRRDTGIYRGFGGSDLPLLTSLDRLGGVNPPHTKAELEAHIFRNFIRYSRPYVDMPPVNDWEMLVLAQHHGLPTRLLDWTYSPLVAAHFATFRRGGDEDRTIWRLDWMRIHRAFGIPPIALLIEDLGRLIRSGREFTPWSLFTTEARVPEYACMIEPPSLSSRIVAQSAVFTLCSSRTESFDSFLDRHGLLSALTRFVVPRREVDRFRDKLDMSNVDERRLFPDLDGLAAHLTRYYS